MTYGNSCIISLPFTALLQRPHGIVKCPLDAHFRTSLEAGGDQGMFCLDVLWILWIRTYYSFHTLKYRRRKVCIFTCCLSRVHLTWPSISVWWMKQFFFFDSVFDWTVKCWDILHKIKKVAKHLKVNFLLRKKYTLFFNGPFVSLWQAYTIKPYKNKK